MRVRILLCALAAFLFLNGQAQAQYVIGAYQDDRGGRIGTYVDRYLDVQESGQNVEIRSGCYSACTIVLGAVPENKICVTRHTELGFHAAWDETRSGGQRTNWRATRALMRMYPSKIRRYIRAHGGLTPRTILLRGKTLARMYPPCDTYASAAN